MKLIHNYTVNGYAVYENKGKYYYFNPNSGQYRIAPPPPPPNYLGVSRPSFPQPRLLDIDKSILPDFTNFAWEAGPLPKLENLVAQIYHPISSVIKYHETADGVYVVRSCIGEQFAIKCLNNPAAECVATLLADKIGLIIPDYMFIPINSAEGNKIINTLTRYKQRAFKKSSYTHLLIMSYVDGVALSSDQLEKPLASLRGEKFLLNKIVTLLGIIAAFDILCFYKDRTPVFGQEGNFDNIVFNLNKQSQICDVVAIDHIIRLTDKPTIFLNLIPTKEVEKAIREIRQDFPQYGINLWEGLPLSFKHLINLEYYQQGKELFKTSIKNGFSHITVALTTRRINEIKVRLNSLGLHYQHFNALERMLEFARRLFA